MAEYYSHKTRRIAARPRNGRVEDMILPQQAVSIASGVGGVQYWTMQTITRADGTTELLLIPAQTVNAVVSQGDVVAYYTSDEDVKLPMANYNLAGAVLIEENQGLEFYEKDGQLYLRSTGGSGLDEEQLAAYLTENNYIQQSDLSAATVGTATKLQTARTINGTAFNGTENITTAKWGYARTIYIEDYSGSNTGPGVSVDGSTSEYLRLPSTITASLDGNATTATRLRTARTLWGQSFNGSSNVSGDMSSVGDISMSTSSPYIDMYDTSTSRHWRLINTGSNLKIQMTAPSSSSFYDGMTIDPSGNVAAVGDVVAYSDGTGGQSPFKFWRPSVSSSGVLSWTNSTSETTPASVNIKGADGEDGASLTYQWSGTRLRIGTTRNGSTTWGSYVDLQGDPGQDGQDGADGGSFNGGTVTQNITIRRSGPTLYLTDGSHGTWRIFHTSTDSNWLNFQRDSLVLFQMATSGVFWYYSGLNKMSDIRMKNRLDDVEGALDKLAHIPVFRYTLKDDPEAREQIGVSAQDVQAAFPEFVSSKPDGTLGVDYAGLSVITMAAMREARARIVKLEAEIGQLKKVVNELKEKVGL